MLKPKTKKKNEFTSYNIIIPVGTIKHWIKASGGFKIFKYTTLLSYVNISYLKALNHLYRQYHYSVLKCKAYVNEAF